MAFTTWHYEIDTLPRLRRTEGDGTYAGLVLPIGVWSDSAEPYRVIVDLEPAGEPWARIGGNENNPAGVVTPVTLDRIAEIRRTEGVRAARPYLEMERRIRESGNLYWEAVFPGLALGTEVRYTITVGPPAGLATRLGPYTLRLTDPEFGYDDIVAMAAHDDVDRSWILYHRRADGYHHLRLDLTDVSTARPDVTVAFPGGPSYALARPWTLPAMPMIDPFTDSIRLSVPDDEVPDPRSLEINGELVDLTAPPRRAKARMMFVHYCMQGLNDLFELPNKEYTPYRTYMQTTMRDEKGTYSSRPNSAEHGEEDGYALTLDAHREFGVRHLWTFNGGVLALIAQDCPEDLARIREDIAAGLLSPTIAGFGGHRLPYYQQDTNRYAIRLGADMMRAVLGSANRVYYPDQRLYKQIPNVMRPLIEADAIRYVVLDASTGFVPYRSTAKPGAGVEGRYLDQSYLWQDQETGLYVMFIDDELRDKIVGNSPEEQARGKLALDLRRKLMYFATRSVADGVRAGHLLVYSDDADKASGNGWFDGDYSGVEIEYNDKFRASLEWIAAHPWVAAVTDADLDPDADSVGTIDIRTATCPSVDPGGVLSEDVYGKRLHFDAWYDNWKDFPAVWLGRPLEEVSQRAEYAIVDWPLEYRNELYDLARMAFAMSLHESQWNKQPLEPLGGLNANERADVVEPEDFVLAASVQARNAHVYLNASVWAQWARSATGPASYCDDGPVVEAVRSVAYRPRDGASPALTGAIDPTGRHWDQDPLPSVLLYNERALVVMDRNGGRVTHVFALRGGRPVCVSGTFKCYQFLTGERALRGQSVGESVLCDGEVLQNTVYTPNHAYIACDVRESRGLIGRKFNPKSTVMRELDCYYPDNFNAYSAEWVSPAEVRWTYARTAPPPGTLSLAEFRMLLAEDRRAKLAGERGIVWHGEAPFAKRIRLDGDTLHVAYEGTRPGHVVANEVCLDLWRGVMYGERLVREVVDEATFAVWNGSGGQAIVRLGSGCDFTLGTLATLTSDPAGYLRLHRALTDCVEITAPEGGDFAYSIEF